PIGSDPTLLGMATGEGVAHLNYLLHRNEAVMEVDADGVAWYHVP
ncbi:MAG: MBL fold metallo-hydrolase, partial [Rhodoferax sp.]